MRRKSVKTKMDIVKAMFISGRSRGTFRMFECEM